MADLYASFLLMLTLCGGLLAAGAHCAATLRPRSQAALLALSVALAALYVLCLWNRPILATLIPSASVIVLGNWLPLFGSFVAGVCAGTRRIHYVRRAILTAATVCLAVYSLYHPMRGEPPWCLRLSGAAALQFQTAESTCSPVAGANLLRLYGIKASEPEMARLCLTREGTHWMGLYRGLKLKVQDTAWDVVVEPFSLDRLRAGRVHSGPAVLSLAFHGRSGDQTLAAGISEETGHTVLMLEHAGANRFEIFDPSPEFGFEVWDESMLTSIREGVLFRLIPRNPAQPSINMDELLLKERFARR